jgi:hypothetical protein
LSGLWPRPSRGAGYGSLEDEGLERRGGRRIARPVALEAAGALAPKRAKKARPPKQDEIAAAAAIVAKAKDERSLA